MSDYDHNHNNNPNYINGLILGALIGAGLVFFLGTKKGKELLNEITDKTLSLFDDVEGLFDELDEDAGEDIQSSLPTPATIIQATPDPLPPPLPETTPPQPHEKEEKHGEEVGEFGIPINSLTDTIDSVSDTTKEEIIPKDEEQTHSAQPLPVHIERLQTQGRRFFRGIPKRG